MRNILQRTVATLLIPAMTLGALPLSAQAAGLISTEQALVTAAGDHHRTKVSDFLARDDVRQALTQQGVSADEAIERVRAMSDAEVATLADRVDSAPAGAGVVGALVTIFVVLLITDILGFTKVFPFTRSIQ